MTKMDPNTIGVKVNAPYGIYLVNESESGSEFLDNDEVSTCPVNSTDQVHHVKINNEFGLYSLILRPRKPEAIPSVQFSTYGD